jgi:hypothetical protein
MSGCPEGSAALRIAKAFSNSGSARLYSPLL